VEPAPVLVTLVMVTPVMVTPVMATLVLVMATLVSQAPGMTRVAARRWGW